VDLSDWFCFAVELVNCTFSGRLRHSWFNGAVPDEKQKDIQRARNEIVGNDFSAMTLEDVGFRTGVDLTAQKLPTDPDYVFIPNASDALERAYSAVAVWTDLSLRRLAMVWINLLRADVAGGQQQLFLRPADFYKPLGKGPVDAVVALLRPTA
jgi:hypothetical protein